MQNAALLRRSVFLIVIIGILHFASAKLYIYWTFWWFDIFMHFLGGFWAGTAALWLAGASGMDLGPDRGKTIFTAFAASLAVGAAWEAYEYVSGNTYAIFMSYPWETAKDMFVDAAGGLAAGLSASRLIETEGNGES